MITFKSYLSFLFVTIILLEKSSIDMHVIPKNEEGEKIINSNKTALKIQGEEYGPPLATKFALLDLTEEDLEKLARSSGNTVNDVFDSKSIYEKDPSEIIKEPQTRTISAGSGHFEFIGVILFFSPIFFCCYCFAYIRTRFFNNGAATDMSSHRHTVTRLSKIPEPFDIQKPCRLRLDEKGLCYASPLDNREIIPTLPNYEEACRLPSNPETILQKASNSNIKHSNFIRKVSHPLTSRFV